MFVFLQGGNQATASAFANPSNNLEARETGLLFMSQADMPFFANLVKGFPDILGCSDCVYSAISVVPTKLISNPVSKFFLEKMLRSLKHRVFRL